MDELTAALHEYLTTATGSNFLGRAVSIGAPWEGSDNLLWRVDADGDEAVVKYYLDAGQARGRRQYDGHERFAPLGIAPQPLWFDRYPTGLSRQLLVYRWVPGTQLDGADRGPLMQMAQAVAQVHGADPTTVRRFSPHPINLAYLWKVMEGGVPALDRWLTTRKAADIAGSLHELVERAKALVEHSLPLWEHIAATPIHGDLKLENMIAPFGAIMLLDWEFFGLGDAAHDIARFFVLNRNHLSTDAQALWLEAYLAVFDQPLLAERVAIYERILPLHHLLYLLHGLQQSLAEDAMLVQANQELLSTTIVAAFAQSAMTLNCSPHVHVDALSVLF